ncbi:MAG: glycosyltransferase family 2 protein [Lachnospiraceae bacterium]
MISLVVPVFNMEQYLPRSMECLLCQTGNYEIILVDDGSQDGSAALCDQYAMEHSKLVHVVHKENGGLSSARNAGMDVAQGEYVIFPDPDDWVEPQFVARLIELQEQYHPELLCIGYNVDFDTRSVPANKGQFLRQMDGVHAQRALLLPPTISGFAWNKLYHLDIIRSNGLRFLDDVGTTEDMDFAFRYLQHCKRVIFSPEDRLYHYYQRSGAATHSNFSRSKLESIRTYEKMIAASTDEELIRAAEEEICNTAVNLVWSYQNSHLRDDEAWKQLRHYLKRYLKQYCTSSRYSCGRKVQAVLAYCVPKLYVALKNQVRQEV